MAYKVQEKDDTEIKNIKNDLKEGESEEGEVNE